MGKPFDVLASASVRLSHADARKAGLHIATGAKESPVGVLYSTTWENTQMLTIGDFSKLSRVPITALRYYDEMGLLLDKGGSLSR